MTDDELKALVRDAVARQLGGPPPERTPAPGRHATAEHASFYRYALPRGDDGDGACLIEPAVRCTHCGFCQSHGY